MDGLDSDSDSRRLTFCFGFLDEDVDEARVADLEGWKAEVKEFEVDEVDFLLELAFLAITRFGIGDI